MKKHFFKILFLAACFLSLYTTSHAQVDSAKADKLKGELIDSICTCISKADPSTVKTVDDIQNLMQNCFTSNTMQATFMEYILASGINLTDMQQIQESMTSLSLELSTKCPAMMTIMMNLAKDPNQLNKLMEQYNKSQPAPSDNKTSEPQKN